MIMKTRVALSALLAASILSAGCTSTKSTITNEGIGYRITREQAKEIVDSSILANFSPDYVNAGPANSLTSSGYVRFALDTHTINATAIPMRGRLPSGQTAEGFGFQTSSSGTMPISGGSKARAVYNLLKQQAQSAGEVLRVR
jgi:predicted small secreted protein